MNMQNIGFSTGALALGDFRTALEILAGTETTAVELSALRDHELGKLMEELPRLDLSQFSYVSVHVPSKFKALSEAQVASGLHKCIDRAIAIVVHPDVISDSAYWEPFGELLCIENMDKRKKTGRTATELEPFFDALPDATFCLDIGHARQVDPSMTEARQMLRRFGDRLIQIHISEVDNQGRHRRLSAASVLAGQSVQSLIREDAAVIVESVIPVEDMAVEIEAARRALSAPPVTSVWENADWGELA